MKKIKIGISSKAAQGLLRFALSLTTVVGVGVLISYLQQSRLQPATAAYLHRAMLEYLLAAIVISVGGALLVEAVDQESIKK